MRGLSDAELDKLYIDTPLEDALIHFSHGRDTWGEDAPPKSHKKKTFQQYRKSLEPSYSDEVRVAWRDLCQLTHPSFSSVAAYIHAVDEEGTKLNIGRDLDFLAILRFALEHDGLLAKLCDDYLSAIIRSSYLLQKFNFSRQFKPRLIFPASPSVHG